MTSDKDIQTIWASEVGEAKEIAQRWMRNAQKITWTIESEVVKSAKLYLAEKTLLAKYNATAMAFYIRQLVEKPRPEDAVYPALSVSEFEEQPDLLPDKYESGTPNGVGIAGLLNIPEVTLYGPRHSTEMTAVVSCRVAGQSVSEFGLRLDDEFGILCRVGLHCAPAAHKTIGTFSEGTIRLAPGIFTSLDDIRAVIAAMEQVARSHE